MQSYSIKVFTGPDIDIIQHCRDYVHILDALNDKWDKVTQDQQEFLKSDEQQRLNRYSDFFLVFMRKCDGFKQVIDQFKQLLASTEKLPDAKRAAQLREHLFDKTLNESTDVKIILDGLVGFYSSPRGNLLKAKDFFDGNALCHGTLALIPGNKAACDYIVKPERVDSVLGGSTWHGQPHLRIDRSRVGLCPSCLESLLKMRIESHHTFLAKIRSSLASNQNSPHAKAAAEKEKQLMLELITLQNDLEKATMAKSALEKIGAETLHNPDEGQTCQTGGADEEDEELMSILQQESLLNPLGSHGDKQDERRNDVSFDNAEESSNSEQSDVSIESVRLTRAVKKKATAKRNEADKNVSTQRKNATETPLTSQQKTKLKKSSSKPSDTKCTDSLSCSKQ